MSSNSNETAEERQIRRDAKIAKLKDLSNARKAGTAPPPIIPAADILNPPSRTDSNDSIRSTTQQFSITSLVPKPKETGSSNAILSPEEERQRQRDAKIARLKALSAARQSGQPIPQAAAVVVRNKPDLNTLIKPPSASSSSSSSEPNTLRLILKLDEEGAFDPSSLWVYHDPIDTAQLQDFVQEEEKSTRPAAGTLSTEKDDEGPVDGRIATLSKVLALYGQADMVQCFKEFADAKVVKNVDAASFMNTEDMDRCFCVYLGMLSSNDQSKVNQSITIMQNAITSMKKHIGDRPCLDKMERLLDQLNTE